MHTTVLSILLAAVPLFGSPSARTQQFCPGGMDPTIASLQECVSHCLSMGNIDNPGIAYSLFSKLDAAQAAQDRGHLSVAISILEAFIHEVQAQAGQHIDETHAEHLMMHARIVIDALSR